MENFSIFGFCRCGCGAKTRLATKTSKRRGYIKGLPKPFVRGHYIRAAVSLDEREPFKIDGEYCTFIQLTNGYIAIIDFPDYKQIGINKWQAIRLGNGRVAAVRTEHDTQKMAYMHIEIAGKRFGSLIDHANRNPLDNRKSNLRHATSLQNSRNVGITKRNKSGYKGVSWHSSAKKWRAVIRVNGRLISLGLFPSKEDAAHAYDEAAYIHFGLFAFLNFPYVHRDILSQDFASVYNGPGRVLSLPHKFSLEEFTLFSERWGTSCLICGVNLNLSWDHISPLSSGGNNELVNLQRLCMDHNSQKSTKECDYRTEEQRLWCVKEQA